MTERSKLYPVAGLSSSKVLNVPLLTTDLKVINNYLLCRMFMTEEVEETRVSVSVCIQYMLATQTTLKCS